MRVSVLVLLLACSEPSQNSSPQAPLSETHAGEATAPDPIAEPSEPVNPGPNAASEPCAELRAETDAILHEPAAACSTDEDCACYPAFIDCGGVRDQASAERLIEVDERRRAAGCDYIDIEGHNFNCAPWECLPQCSSGICSLRSH